MDHPSRQDSVSAALREVMARYDGMMRGIGHRHGFPAAELDELRQDVRIRLWRALSDGEKIASAPASYVYRTTMSAAVDRIRRARVRREETLDSAEAVVNPLPPLSGRRPGPAEDLDGAELMEVLAQAIAALSDSRRPVVRMHLAGYGREEISELLGWSEAKTRNLLYRGLAELRESLQRLGVRPGVTT
jgi:RNA polymerase sigma factor (sigma-70 family)